MLFITKADNSEEQTAFARRNFSWDWPIRKSGWKSVIYPYPWTFCFSFLLCPLNVKMWFWFLSARLQTPLLHHDFVRLASALGQLSAREADFQYGKLFSEVVREQQETRQTHKNGRMRRKAALGFDCSAITAESKESLASLGTNAGSQSSSNRSKGRKLHACRTNVAHSLLSRCPNPHDIFLTTNSSRPLSNLKDFFCL